MNEKMTRLLNKRYGPIGTRSYWEIESLEVLDILQVKNRKGSPKNVRVLL